MLFWQKLIAILSLIAAIFLAGMYTEHKFHLAGENKVITKQLDKAEKGQNKIIKFNQDLRKTHADKEPCFNTDLPLDVRGLLQ